MVADIVNLGIDLKAVNREKLHQEPRSTTQMHRAVKPIKKEAVLYLLDLVENMFPWLLLSKKLSSVNTGYNVVSMAFDR